MKKNGIIFIPIVFVLLVLLAGMLVPRQKGRAPSTGADTWDLGAGITARLEDDGSYGYILKVEGTGMISDFASPKDTPWYGRSGRVSQILISEGITQVGGNAFAACANAKTALLPESVTVLGSCAFSQTTKLLAQGPLDMPDGMLLFQYSEERPESGGQYWHFQDGAPVVWETVKILFIGNSFTYTFDIDQLLGKIAQGAGVNVDVQRITIGAHNLSQFADPADKGGAMVEKALRAASDYDIIVLQEQSTRPMTNPGLFLEGAQQLKEKIDQTQDHCQVYLYATWGYPKRATDQTIPEMESVIRAAYEHTAQTLEVPISPVGEAFTTVYTDYPEINLYSGDQQHPSYAGSYLSACVHAAALLGIDPRESSFLGFPLPDNPHPGDPVYAQDVTFTEETAKILQSIAYSTVFGK